jgi:pimeloyl-ACP methyl ester carboxylesterase
VYRTGRIAGHPYVRVGGGSERPLAFVPGLNDPLQRVTDSRWFSLSMAAYCRRYAGDRAVYMVSRPSGLPAGTTTRTMAAGYEGVLSALCDRHGSSRVDLVGISMGGFLVTHLAAEWSDRVGKAVLALAADRLDERGRRRVSQWRSWGSDGEWSEVYLDAADVVARALRRRGMRVAVRAYDRLCDPPESGPSDFLASARACLEHDASDRLEAIERPTLVLGGDGDPFFSLSRFRATARELPDGRFARIHGASHETVIQHPNAFESAVKRFL